MQNINVNIVPDSYPQTIRYSQGDVGREFKINVVGFTIPTGATVKIQATKPSGFGFSVAGTVAGNAVSFTTTAIMTDEAGRFPAELEITKDSVVIGTANFIMWGEANPHPEGTTDGQQGTIIPELTLLVERVEAAADKILDMEVVANTLPAGSQATYSYDEDLNKATFGIPQGEAGAGAAGVVADAYSSSKTYKVGDYALHNSNLYRCTTAITTAEAFTAAHWTQIVLANDVSDLKTDFDKVVDGADFLSIPWEKEANGQIRASDGVVISSTASAYTKAIDVSKYSLLKYKRQAITESSDAGGMAFYDENNTFILGNALAVSQSARGYVEAIVYVPTNAKYARFGFWKDDSTYGKFEVYGNNLLENRIESAKNSQWSDTSKGLLITILRNALYNEDMSEEIDSLVTSFEAPSQLVIEQNGVTYTGTKGHYFADDDACITKLYTLPIGTTEVIQFIKVADVSVLHNLNAIQVDGNGDIGDYWNLKNSGRYNAEYKTVLGAGATKMGWTLDRSVPQQSYAFAMPSGDIIFAGSQSKFAGMSNITQYKEG